MFDMAKWDDYLGEYCQNAERDGATPCDLVELLMLQTGRLIPRIKAEEACRSVLNEYRGVNKDRRHLASVTHYPQ